ncbi:hypothetical protein X744_29900 [Mesorhizobium sp. LNJC372A00]|nr:hypothetical protein X745_30685 [Mesorhizobium sp. LNJC374B00]ESY52325.1 hypothetical protein X744_29900 [Mesorhizobium sp. LNJC372A00]
MLRRAASMLADEADRMTVVDHDHGAILFRQVANPAEIGNDAVHRKSAIGCDQFEAAAPRPSSTVFPALPSEAPGL